MKLTLDKSRLIHNRQTIDEICFDKGISVAYMIKRQFICDFIKKNIMLLSKFVLFMIMTKELKNLIEEKLIERVKKGYTKIYTTMPVSMKYRGAFKKVDEMKNYKSLAYDFEFGQEESIQSAIKRYLKLVENRNKDKDKDKSKGK